MTLSLRPAPAVDRRVLRRAAYGLLVAAAVLALWVGASTLLAGARILPTPWALARAFATDWPLLMSNSAVTLSVAVRGLLAAVLVIGAVALLCAVAPRVEPVAHGVAVVINVIPFVAIAPILVVSLSSVPARITITAISISYPILVQMLFGIRAASQEALDVAHVTGAGPLRATRFVRLPAGLPSVFSAMQIAVPAAVLGSLVSDFFGADRGLGVVLVNAQQSLDLPRTWAVAVLAGAYSFVGFVAVAGLARLAVPWARTGAQLTSAVAGVRPPRRSRGASLAVAGVSAAVLLGFWQSLRSVFGLDAYIVKSPADVVTFLTGGRIRTTSTAAEFWPEFGVALAQSAVDAAVGLAVGMAGAVAVAVAISMAPALARVVFPASVLVRSVPIVALTPLIALMFGRDLLGVTVIVSLLTFFPTLVAVTAALDAVPRAALDVVRSFGGGVLAAMVKVRLFYALPALGASLRIAVPAAVAGATLAEWLATGKGIGAFIVNARADGNFIVLWSSGVLLCLIVLVISALLTAADTALSRRLSG